MGTAGESNCSKTCATNICGGTHNAIGVGWVIKIGWFVKGRLLDIHGFKVAGHTIQAIFSHFKILAAVFQGISGGKDGVERGHYGGHHDSQNQKRKQDFQQGEAVAGCWLRCSILDTRCSMLDARCWIMATSFLLQYVVNS